MTNDEYHRATTHISKSGLDLMARSPGHYYARYLDPNRVPEEPKPHFVIGSVTHMAVLEPQFLEQHYFILDDTKIVAEIGGGNPRSTTRYKDWKAGQLAANAGRQEVRIDDFDAVRRMRDAVWTHPAAAYLLEAGYAEQSFFFDEAQTGAPVKIRPDWLNHEHRWIVDLKTTDDASPAGFGKSFFNFRYDVQAALLFDGMAQIDGAWNGVAYIAVEKQPPYAVAVYYATADDVDRGRAQYLPLLQRYLECGNTQQWPCYPQSVMAIERPSWIR